MEKQSYYMVIPAEIWESEISAKAMILYGHITVLANNKKYCWAENAYFTKVMKISEATVKRCLLELEEEKFIIRDLIYIPGTKQVQERRIYLNVRSGSKNESRPGSKNEPRPGRKNDLDNTTRLNTTKAIITHPYEFTSEKEQIKTHKAFLKAEYDLSWDKLLSLWPTTEYPGTLKKTKKTYWDKLGTETHQSILQMVEGLGSDRKYLEKIWISDCFERKKMNTPELKKEIERIKTLSGPSKPGHDLIDLNNYNS